LTYLQRLRDFLRRNNALAITIAVLLSVGGSYLPARALYSIAVDRLSVGSTTAPALTSCGTTPAITGTDLAGIVTMGTTATGCVITFNTPFATAPVCVVTWIATPLASQSYVTAAASITLTQTSTSNNKAQYVCVAQAGG
jgi:hypothetical protein